MAHARWVKRGRRALEPRDNVRGTGALCGLVDRQLRRFVMIRAIIERRLQKGEHISRLLQQLRSVAMAQVGYISGETLINTERPDVVTVMSTWRSLEDWKAWERSGPRVALDREIESLLAEPPIVKTYKIVSPEELEYLEDPATWGV